ncbi:MAG: hypothetical protein ACR2PT_03960 [Endozoicomonas sp.]
MRSFRVNKAPVILAEVLLLIGGMNAAWAQSLTPLFSIPLGDSSSTAYYPAISAPGSANSSLAVAGAQVVDISRRVVVKTLPEDNLQSLIVKDAIYSISDKGQTMRVYDLNTAQEIQKYDFIDNPYHLQTQLMTKGADNIVSFVSNNLVNQEFIETVVRRFRHDTGQQLPPYTLPLPGDSVFKHRNVKNVFGSIRSIFAPEDKPGVLYLAGSYSFDTNDIYLNSWADVIAELSIDSATSEVSGVTYHVIDERTSRTRPLMLTSFTSYAKVCGKSLSLLGYNFNYPLPDDPMHQYNSLMEVTLPLFNISHIQHTTNGKVYAQQWSAAWSPDCHYVYLFNNENHDSEGYQQKTSILQFDIVNKRFAKQMIRRDAGTYHIGDVTQCGNQSCLITVWTGEKDWDPDSILEAYAIPWE